jgi:ABC-type multidrug transport system ATPase subunit
LTRRPNNPAFVVVEILWRHRKTSLLNVLSGRMTSSTTNVTVAADNVTWNGRKLDVTDLATRQTFAFVAQDDSLPITATPREAILFSARLRLDKDKTDKELVVITDKMLAALHLGACADTIVGGALLKGISGGERKRTSVAVELGMCLLDSCERFVAVILQ